MAAISKAKQMAMKQAPNKTPPKPRAVPDDPKPEGLSPDPITHLHSFVARINISVPPCNLIPIKILNMLAYAISNVLC